MMLENLVRWPQTRAIFLTTLPRAHLVLARVRKRVRIDDGRPCSRRSFWKPKP